MMWALGNRVGMTQLDADQLAAQARAGDDTGSVISADLCVCARYPGVPFRLNERREETARRRLRRRLRMCSLAHQQGCRATAREPLSLKLANARRLAGCGGGPWHRGNAAGGRGWISIFVYRDSASSSTVRWSSACRTPHAVHATQPVELCCSTRSPFASGELARRAELSVQRTFGRARRSRIAGICSRARAPVPAAVRRLRPQSPTMPILDTAVQYSIHSTSGTTW